MLGTVADGALDGMEILGTGADGGGSMEYTVQTENAPEF